MARKTKNLKGLKAGMPIIITASELAKIPRHELVDAQLVALLKGIKEYGSLCKAVKIVGVAYSHAWQRMRAAEAAFGFNFIVRNGAHGSVLTPEGQKLVDVFDALQDEVSAFAEERLKALLR